MTQCAIGLLRTQTNFENLEDEDPQISYMISSWARMCKILGKDFEKYLPVVMGPVLKTASFKPEIAVVDEDEVKEISDEEDWQFVTIGDQQSFGIKTTGLEEKATACSMLVCYAKELKEGFAQYTEEVTKLMVPLFKFYFHDGVRSAAAESMPHLLECAQIRGEQYVFEMWNYICNDLIKAIDSEPEQEVLAELELFDSLENVIADLNERQERNQEKIKLYEREIPELKKNIADLTHIRDNINRVKCISNVNPLPPAF